MFNTETSSLDYHKKPQPIIYQERKMSRLKAIFGSGNVFPQEAEKRKSEWVSRARYPLSHNNAKSGSIDILA